MSWILLTNDDGPESPALVPFARSLRRLGEVRVVVPDRERSWVAKAITRHDPVVSSVEEIDGVRVWMCTGYPADAVQLGVHALFDEAPAMVIAGINLGYNHGAGFLMSSGTVGAAVEAWIAGLPSLAFSTGTMVDWHDWRRRVLSTDAAEAWERTARACAGLAADLVEGELLEHADVVSVNLPFDPAAGVERRLTSIARVGYDRLFRLDGTDRFVHDFGGGFREYAALDGTDVAAAKEGAISITPVRLPQAASVPDDVRESVERR